MELNAAKSICLVLFFLIPISFGLFPVCVFSRCECGKLNASKRGKSILSFINCFAGGVFLGTCLLGLLTEGQEQFEEYRQLVNLDSEFPFFQVGIGVGFFLVALMEKIAYRLYNRDGHEASDSCRPHDKKACGDVELGTWSQTSVITGTATTEHRSVKCGLPCPPCVNQENGICKSSPQNGQAASLSLSANDLTTSSQSSLSECHPRPPMCTEQNNPTDNGCVCSTPYDNKILKSVTTLDQRTETANVNGNRFGELQNDDDKAHNDHTDDEQKELEGLSSMSSLRVSLLLLAMSFHTIFDGLAVGLQTDLKALWSLLGALVIHKVIVSTCLGIKVGAVSSGKPLRAVSSMLLFAVMSSVGVAIGMGVTSGTLDMPAQLLTGSILQAISTGAFLYVTCFEILGLEMATHDGSVSRVFTAALGFGTVSAVEVWAAGE